MKKVLIVVGLVILGGIFWLLVSDSDEPLELETQQDFPVRTDESTTSAGLVTYESEAGGLSFQYPDTWNVTPGADNEPDSQLFTVESPLDANEFYFCLDLNRVSTASQTDFVTTDAEVLAVEPLDNNRSSVIFRVEGVDGLLWSAADEAPEVGDTEFTSEITNAAGDRLQALGRFNCRETEKPDLTVEEFQAARWFEETKAIINSLEF